MINSILPMVSNFKKNRKRDLWGSFLLHIGGVLILFVFVLLIIANIRIYQKKEELHLKLANLQNQIKDIQNRNNDLKQGILKASDDQYIEKVAREELDLQKQGEKVVSFIMSQNPPQKVDNSKQNIMQIWLGWLGNSWNFIKSKF